MIYIATEIPDSEAMRIGTQEKNGGSRCVSPLITNGEIVRLCPTNLRQTRFVDGR